MNEIKKAFKSSFDKKYNFPKDVKPNIFYAFTLSPPHILVSDSEDIETVFDENLRKYNEVKRYFNTEHVQQCCHVILYPEYSFDGRLHYHGFLKIYSVYFFSIMVVPWLKEYATLDIQLIKCLETPCIDGDYIPDNDDDYYKWMIYVTKNYHHFNDPLMIRFFGTSRPCIDNLIRQNIIDVPHHEQVKEKAKKGRPKLYV